MKTILALAMILVGGQTQAESLIFLNNTLQADITWEKEPKASQEAIMKIEWRNSQDQILTDPAEFQVVLWMPSMNHGSAPTTINKIDLGVYRVSNMQFIMGGEWDVQVILMTANGTKETQKISLQLPGGHHH